MNLCQTPLLPVIKISELGPWGLNTLGIGFYGNHWSSSFTVLPRCVASCVAISTVVALMMQVRHSISFNQT